MDCALWASWASRLTWVVSSSPSSSTLRSQRSSRRLRVSTLGTMYSCTSSVRPAVRTNVAAATAAVIHAVELPVALLAE